MTKFEDFIRGVFGVVLIGASTVMILGGAALFGYAVYRMLTG